MGKSMERLIREELIAKGRGFAVQLLEAEKTGDQYTVNLTRRLRNQFMVNLSSNGRMLVDRGYFQELSRKP